jgi:hypothetical protein
MLDFVVAMFDFVVVEFLNFTRSAFSFVTWEALTAIGTIGATIVAVFGTWQNAQENKRQKQLGLFITTTQKDFGADNESGVGVIVNNSQVVWEVTLEKKADFGFSQDNMGPKNFAEIMDVIHEGDSKKLEKVCLEHQKKKNMCATNARKHVLQPQETQPFHIANIAVDQRKTLAHFAWFHVTQKSNMETKCINYIYRYSDSKVLQPADKNLYNVYQPCDKWVLEHSWLD